MTARDALGLATLLLLAVLVLWLMRQGWLRRRDRTASLVPALPQEPADLGALVHGPVDVTYLSTAIAGQWLERVAAHGLGVRAAAVLAVHEAGVLVDRRGAERLFLPADSLVSVRLDAGVGGVAIGGDLAVVVRWRAAGGEVETGVLPPREDRHALVEAVGRILPAGDDAGGPDPTRPGPGDTGEPPSEEST